jgi:hypothetical protein
VCTVTPSGGDMVLCPVKVAQEVKLCMCVWLLIKLVLDDALGVDDKFTLGPAADWLFG